MRGTSLRLRDGQTVSHLEIDGYLLSAHGSDHQNGILRVSWPTEEGGRSQDVGSFDHLSGEVTWSPPMSLLDVIPRMSHQMHQSHPDIFNIIQARREFCAQMINLFQPLVERIVVKEE